MLKGSLLCKPSGEMVQKKLLEEWKHGLIDHNHEQRKQSGIGFASPILVAGLRTQLEDATIDSEMLERDWVEVRSNS